MDQADQENSLINAEIEVMNDKEKSVMIESPFDGVNDNLRKCKELKKEEEKNQEESKINTPKIFSEKDSSTTQKIYDVEKFERESKEGPDEHELNNKEELTNEIDKMRDEISDLEKQLKLREEAETKNVLETLESPPIITEQLQTLESEPSNSNLEWIELEKQLTEGFDKYELKDVEELKTEIDKVRDEISDLEKQGKLKRLAEKKQYLEELETLQVVFQKLHSIKPQPTKKQLEKKLAEGLVEHELKDVEELITEIDKVKDEITNLEKQEKLKRVAEKKCYLETLEALHAIAKQLQTIESEISNINPEWIELEKQLKEGLVEHDLKDVEELLTNIDKVRDEIADLEKKGKSKKAAERKNLLETLLALKVISDKLQAKSNLTDSSLKKDNYMPDYSLESLKKMPICFEKSLLCLENLIWGKLNQNTVLINLEDPSPEKIDRNTQEELDSLEHRFKIEEISSTEAKKFIDKIRTYVKSQLWQAAFEELRCLIKIIRPLDIQKIFRLASSIEKTAELVKDENIILLLGGTGCGKSTTVHFLAGSIMHETRINNIYHIAPLKVKNSALNDVITSPFSNSETKYIFAVPVNLKDVGLARNEKIVICDTPGFEDTNGPEVDIVNGIGILKTIQQCESVKPVVLISYKSVGDRLAGLKSLVHTLVSMIKDMKDQLRTFSFIFTKYPEKEKSSIHASLQNIRERMSIEEGKDEGFISFFDEMLTQTAKQAITLDPIKDTSAAILKILKNSPAIKNPKEFFTSSSISEKSRAALNDQLQQHNAQILSAIKRSDYSLIHYKLDEMKKLYELLSQEKIQQVYSSCVEAINKHLNQTYDIVAGPNSRFNRSLTNLNTLTSEDIEEYKNYYENAKKADQIREELLGSEIVRSSAYLENLNAKVEEIYADKFKSGQVDQSLKVAMDKIKLLSIYFPHINSLYEEKLKHLSNLIETFVESAGKHLKQNEYERYVDEMTNIALSISLFKDHLPITYIEEGYSNLKESFTKSLKSSIKEFSAILTQDKLTKNDAEFLKNGILKFEKMKNIYKLELHFPIQEILNEYNLLNEKILEYFRALYNKINEKYEQNKEGSLLAIRDLIEEMTLIRTIPGIDFLTSQLYYKALETICGFVDRIRREVEQILMAIFEQKENINKSKISNLLFCLENAKWLENYEKSAIHQDAMRNIQEQLMHYTRNLAESLKAISLDLDNSEKIPQAIKLISKIKEIESLEKNFPELSGLIIEARSNYIAQMEAIGQRIQEFLIKWKEDFDPKLNEIVVEEEKQNGQKVPQGTLKEDTETKIKQRIYILDYRNAEKILKFLREGIKAGAVEKEFRHFHSDLEELIRKYCQFILNEMENNLNKIKDPQPAKQNDRIRVSQSIYTRLKEILITKRLFPEIAATIEPDIVDDWKEKLDNYIHDLASEMAELNIVHSNEKLSNLLSIAKALTVLEEFINKRKLNEIISLYQKLFFGDAEKVYETGVKALENYEYHNVNKILLNLEKVKDDFYQDCYEQFKIMVESSIEKLIEEAKSLTLFLLTEPDARDKLSRNLKNLKNAKTLSSYFNDKDMVEKAFNFFKIEISKGLDEKLKKIEGILDCYDFIKVEKMRTELTLISNTLNGFFGEIFKTINDKIEKTITSKLKVLNEKFINMGFEAYLHNPPKDLIDKLEEVKDEILYRDTLENIKKVLLINFQKELKTFNVSKELYSHRFENLNFAFNCLPHSLKTSLQLELARCKNDLDKAQENHKNQLVTVLESNDVKRIKEFSLECLKVANMTSAQKIQKHILGSVQKIHYDINNASELNIMFSEIKKLHLYQEYFKAVITQKYSEVKVHLADKFKSKYFSFTNQLFDKDLNLIIEQNNSDLEKKFDSLLEFIDFRNDIYKNYPVLKDLFPNDLSTKIQELKTKLSNLAFEIQSNFDEALQKVEISSLKIILDVMENLNSLFVKIKSCNTFDGDLQINSKDLKNLKSLKEMAQCISEKCQEAKKKIISQELVNDEVKKSDKSREVFFQNIAKDFALLQNLKDLKAYVSIEDMDKVFNECSKVLKSNIDVIITEAIRLLSEFEARILSQKQNYSKFDLYYKVLISLKKAFSTIKIVDINLEKIDDKIIFIIMKLTSSIQKDSKVECVAKTLIELKWLAENMTFYKTKINQKIDEILISYKTQNAGAKMLASLGTILNQDKTGIGATIIAEHTCFQGYSLSLFNTKTQKHGIDYVLTKIDGDNIDKEQLSKRFKEFDCEYKKIIKDYLHPNMQLDELISNIKFDLNNISQQPNKVIWDAPIRQMIPNLAAKVFGLWTLKNANHYFEAHELDDRNTYLFQPHAAQIVSIFRLFGIGDKFEELQNNLVQIGTGEGKSLVLAIAAAIFALLGFEVSCACYSEYLSQRDFKAFEGFFDSLGILEHIHYGTFNKICEDVINHNGDIRKVIENLISRNINEAQANNQKQKRAKILLIDEVDVFFSKEFYGNVYTPSASLRDKTITNLLDLIWKERKCWTLTKLKETLEYQNCCERFKDWGFFIEEAAKDILSDLSSYESHDYVIMNDKIGYKDQDTIGFNIVYGYKTLFAYYDANEARKITLDSLERNKCLRIKCGNYSYAEIPRQFNYIMGVTGTLKSLSEPQKQFITDDYKIKKNTFTPSVFGESHFSFIPKSNVRIEDTDNYFATISQEAKDQLIAKRAVFVFMESAEQLASLHMSGMLPNNQPILIATDDLSMQDKEAIIKGAPTTGQLTLFTRSFGRGTDFVCRDQTVISNGGVHIIQTFLSEELSEEVQIKGRTARQGERGSYSMVLLDSSLEKFQISKQDLQSTKYGQPVNSKDYETQYDFLNEKRNIFFNSRYQDTKEYVQKALKQHQESFNFLEDLFSGDLSTVKSFLLKQNKGLVVRSKISRTLCLMDATGSMSNLLQKAKNTVGTTFERVFETLRDREIDPDSFQIQFAVYRNYSSGPEKILQYSPWETKADSLHAFMERISAEGGQNNEAIEIGLWHANQENEKLNISQVILIGDAPANTKSEVEAKRKGWDWKRTKFSNETYYKIELDKLKQARIPVHAFYVDIKAKENFQEISRETNGRCEFLEIHNKYGTCRLIDLFTEEVLRKVGDANGGNGDALVNAYKEKYGKSYT